MTLAILLVVVSYCVGAIPFGLMVASAMGLGDVRKIGSGNIGATNVLRTGNKTAAALTLILDALKGAAAVLIARWLIGETAALVAGLGAFVGHLFPIWLRFKGGKGVATFLGVTLAVNLPAGLVTCVVWLGTAYALRYSSLAALIGSATAPLWLALFGRADVVWLGAAMAVLVWLRHLPNIRRLRDGTEPRIGKMR